MENITEKEDQKFLDIPYGAEHISRRPILTDHFVFDDRDRIGCGSYGQVYKVQNSTNNMHSKKLNSASVHVQLFVKLPYVF